MTDWTGEIANLAPDEHDDIAWFGHVELPGLELADPAVLELLTDALDLQGADATHRQVSTRRR